MDFFADNDCLIIFLSGKIDSRNVADVEKSVRGIINENIRNDLIFDADKLNYISSAGLRFLLKFRKVSQKKFLIENVSKDVYEIFDMTGLTKFFDVRKNFATFQSRVVRKSAWDAAAKFIASTTIR